MQQPLVEASIKEKSVQYEKNTQHFGMHGLELNIALGFASCYIMVPQYFFHIVLAVVTNGSI